MTYIMVLKVTVEPFLRCLGKTLGGRGGGGGGILPPSPNRVKMAEICRGVQFGVRKIIVGHKSVISYQQTRFPGVNVSTLI